MIKKPCLQASQSFYYTTKRGLYLLATFALGNQAYSPFSLHLF